MKLEKIKLIIWDLDDTFWKGTLSEGSITPIPRNVKLIKQLSDIGIINSINSKNDLTQVERELIKLKVREYFVFLSINWDAKGMRVKNQIDNMQLRAQNVLFIDDNLSNIEEVKFYNSGIMTAIPSDLNILADLVSKSKKKDKEHKRLKQYKILEKKYVEKINYLSNEEFLFNSSITVIIKNDCINKIDRIHTMVMRTNQLNYTKVRLTFESLRLILNDTSYNCGYVSVRDRFGNYGIIGFFACKNNKLEHFLFSCRILGMGIEQYVYSFLNYPKIEICGEVASNLKKNYIPPWVNNKKNIRVKDSKHNSNEVKVLFKGPCDLQQIFSYIEDTNTIDCEFSFISPKSGVSIEQYNHTYHIAQAVTLSPDKKLKIIRELPFSDPKLFSDKIFKKDYDIIFLSMLTDGNLGVYERKNSGEFIAFGEYYYSLTDKNNWNDYINGNIFNANCKFSIASLEDFSDKYNYIGRISIPEMINNLKIIRENINPNTLLVLMLGVEKPYLKNEKISYKGRNCIHKEINNAIREFAVHYNNIELLDFNNYVKKQEDFYNNINHFIKPVYYNVTKDIINIINSRSNKILNYKGKYKVFYDYLKQIIKKIFRKV